MAISASTIGGVNDTTNATVYSFAPSTPSANALLLLWIDAHSTINTNGPTVTGMNSTWTAVANQLYDMGLPNKRLDLFWALGPAPDTSRVTMTYVGTRSNGIAVLHQYTGVGANGPVQSATSVVASASNLVCILSSLASAGNVVAGGFGGVLNSAMTASTDFQLLSTFNQNSPVENLGSCWTSGNRSRVTMFQASATSMGGIAVEISAATPGGAGSRSPYYSHYYHRMVAA